MHDFILGIFPFNDVPKVAAIFSQTNVGLMNSTSRWFAVLCLLLLRSSKIAWTVPQRTPRRVYEQIVSSHFHRLCRLQGRGCHFKRLCLKTESKMLATESLFSHGENGNFLKCSIWTEKLANKENNTFNLFFHFV